MKKRTNGVCARRWSPGSNWSITNALRISTRSRACILAGFGRRVECIARFRAQDTPLTVNWKGPLHEDDEPSVDPVYLVKKATDWFLKNALKKVVLTLSFPTLTQSHHL
jgi:hypothetical protein